VGIGVDNSEKMINYIIQVIQTILDVVPKMGHDENIHESVNLLLQHLDKKDEEQQMIINIMKSVQEGTMKLENFDNKLAEELPLMLKGCLDDYWKIQNENITYLMQELTNAHKKLSVDLDNKLQFISERIKDQLIPANIIDVIATPQREIMEKIQLVLNKVISEPAKIGENLSELITTENALILARFNVQNKNYDEKMCRWLKLMEDWKVECVEELASSINKSLLELKNQQDIVLKGSNLIKSIVENIYGERISGTELGEAFNKLSKEVENVKLLIETNMGMWSEAENTRLGLRNE
jgi:hypothetical protein